MDESSGQVPTGTVTFLFSDIEGSTGLAQELDLPLYRELIEQHHRLMRTAFGAYGGVERGTEGDGFLVVFRDAPSAVAAAVDAQRSLDGAAWPAGVKVRVRMGLHSGAGIPGGDDYIGLDINRAARIASAAHGGQVLISDSTRALSERTFPKGVAVLDVGEHRLKGLDLPERMYQLTIEGLISDFPPLRTGEVGAAHLPARMTSFIGRRADLDELARLLMQSRLITLVGPGGAGKTSLATELAREVAGVFADGAWFVDLAPLTDAGLVGSTVARSLSLREQAERPIFELLKAHLSQRELLLVLDNFEHLLAAGEVVEALLVAAPGLKVLVTSRSILNLYGEQEFAVSPLALPDLGDVADVDQLAAYEAVALFVERARLVKSGFSITNENASAVAQICVRLDGLPLALELAASRIRMLEPQEIRARLEQRLPVLSTRARTVPMRQQTLRGAIEWSYELLHPAEQELFTRLAIFAGGCTLEGAEAICNPGGELGIDTFHGITSLVDQSLVRQRVVFGESRFELLQTIHDYGRDRLESAGNLEEMGRRHLRYHRDLAEVAEPHLMGPDQATWLDRIDREHDNLRGALRWALDEGDTDSGLRLGAAVWRFWFQRGYLREGRSWLESLLALEPDIATATRAKGYTALGGLTYWLSDVEATERAYQSALSHYRQIGDREAEADALYNLAFVPVMRGDTEEARRLGEASLALAVHVGRPDLVAQIQAALGIGEAIAGDAQAALRLLGEALTFFRAAGNYFATGTALGGIAQAHRRLGDHQAGRIAYREAVRMFTEAKDLPNIGAMLDLGSAVESSAGRHLEAILMMGSAAALRESTGASDPQALRRLGDVEDAARQAMGDEAFEKALAEGRRMTLDQAVEYATSLAD